MLSVSIEQCIKFIRVTLLPLNTVFKLSGDGVEPSDVLSVLPEDCYVG